MDPKTLAEAADSKKFVGFISGLPDMHHHNHRGDGSVETNREADHYGHHILIRTTYRIEVDGRVLPVPLALGNDGQLHCHSLPNYQFDSAVDMVKRLIEAYPEDFPQRGSNEPQRDGRSGHEHAGGSSHEHEHE